MLQRLGEAAAVWLLLLILCTDAREQTGQSRACWDISYWAIGCGCSSPVHLCFNTLFSPEETEQDLS